MGEHIVWEEPDQEHIESRAERYLGAVNIEPAWTQEVANDPYRIVTEPDPRIGAARATRIVGYSDAAGFVITVIVYREQDVMYGVTAWKTSGRELREYLEGRLS